MVFNGILLGFYVILMGFQWDFNGILMGFYGILMELYGILWDFNGISMGSNMSKRLENQHEDFWAILWDLMGERPNMMIFKASKNDVGFNVNPGI